MKKNEKKCAQCGVLYKEKEIARVFGEKSAVILGGFCSVKCYTDSESQKINEEKRISKLIINNEIETKPRIFAVCTEEGIEKLFWNIDKAEQDALEFKKDFPNTIFWVKEIFPS